MSYKRHVLTTTSPKCLWIFFPDPWMQIFSDVCIFFLRALCFPLYLKSKIWNAALACFSKPLWNSYKRFVDQQPEAVVWEPAFHLCTYESPSPCIGLCSEFSLCLLGQIYGQYLVHCDWCISLVPWISTCVHCNTVSRFTLIGAFVSCSVGIGNVICQKRSVFIHLDLNHLTRAFSSSAQMKTKDYTHQKYTYLFLLSSSSKALAGFHHRNSCSLWRKKSLTLTQLHASQAHFKVFKVHSINCS